MQRFMCKGKIHRATVTEADLDYVGSVTIDRKLMKEANIIPYEMVQIANIRNAARWKTYAIPGPDGSGQICLNGPPANLFSVDDLVIILSQGLMTDEEIEAMKPRVVFVDGDNEVTSIEEHDLSSEEAEL
ncbi:aspartate 1-decarboxylase [Barrientosiimonas marina]|uniref:Aspartate 1-decarboxylase n=1 Tax=Lentibacillus kimchii TaxID=1542911 RepID=A0ABW2UV08_9BACI